jgi:hypothetical protein
MSQNIYSSLVSIMTEHINQYGKVDDVELCKTIAAWIGMLSFDAKTQMELWHGDVGLYEFIRDYGEDVDETYMGRDEFGEKVYHTFNPETNWITMIRKELVANKFYERYSEWQKKQEVAA